MESVTLCLKTASEPFMKKIIVSVGMIAAGAASLEAAYAPGLNSMEASKFWSVSGTLRGFYDDNYNTSPTKQGSAGYEVSPSVNFNVPLQQTELGLRYTYGLYYYQDRRNQGNNPYDQTHQVDLWLDHAFTERWQSTVSDTLAVGQEPGLLTPGTGGAGQPAAQPLRIEGNNIVNSAQVTLTTDWTRLFSTLLSYNNVFTDYENNGTTEANLATAGASQSALLNGIEQSISLQPLWIVAPETTVGLGYTFQWQNYDGSQPVSQNLNGTFNYSSSRNNYSHIGFVSLQRSFLPNLNVSAKLGVQDGVYYNNYPSTTTSLTPYAVSSATYTYAPGSYAQLNVSHEQNSTYVATVNTSNGSQTQSQQSTVVSASINHQITAKLMGSIIGNIQVSTFYQGQYDNQNQDLYSLGLNLTYAINQHLSAEVGYNFDALQTPVPSSDYNRNRVYLGVTAAY